MNVLWFSWKDELHPLAGGAETVSSEIRKRLVKDGHTVRLITARYEGSSETENINGVRVYRCGRRFGVYWAAYKLFKKKFKNWPDLIIDEMNTLPFGCAFYTKKRTVLLAYQLARQVWFYQMVFPLSLVGYLIEPLYLFALSRKYETVLTESESTRQDLKRYGFNPKSVHVFRIGMALKPVEKLKPKHNMHTVLLLGALRPMKRTLHAVKGFEKARDHNPQLRLLVAGDVSSAYGKKVANYVIRSRHHDAIEILGRVTNEKRIQLLQDASVIVVTSVKEGWGLIVTEANSQGTPAVAYDTDGLRDSIQDGKTGFLVPSGNTKSLGSAINSILSEPTNYERLRTKAWSWSKEFTFNNSYQDFLSVIKDTDQ